MTESDPIWLILYEYQDEYQVYEYQVDEYQVEYQVGAITIPVQTP